MSMARSISLLALSLVALTTEAAPIILNTDVSPPYQIRTPEGLEGSSVRTLECVFESMQQAYEIKILPWERAIYEVEQNRADGFFSATQMPRAEPYATLSAPLALEKWFWYSNTDSAVKPTARPRTGAIRGSNQLAWLLEKGTEVDQVVGTTEQLLQLLDRGRIDRFLADQSTLRTVLTQQPVQLRPGFEQFYKYATLGVYFSNRLLAREPDLLQRFNRQVYYCLAETPALHAAEKKQIAQLHRDLYQSWADNRVLIDAVRQQNREHVQLHTREILALDRQWVKETKTGSAPIADALLARPFSAWLKTQQAESNGLITEIMATDRLGLLVAASERTTDYWQGDEAKFSEAFFAINNEAYIGTLQYDQSSQAYQVHISEQIRDPDTKEVIGTLIIGLNIERALLKSDLGGKL